ncbi:MAG TPA: DoxX family protein [Pyrinomonadaceae bacterium]|jgi:DoxX.|nr:DoxX family protein [Pyrinomonadaceae bacterium]
MNAILWVVQVILAVLFLFAGGTKLILSTEQLESMAPPNAIHLPGLFLKFIGVLEVLGAFGLILPGLTKIKRNLTPLSAVGLLIIMIGAVVITVMGTGARDTIVPLITGLLCALVAYGRRAWR